MNSTPSPDPNCNPNLTLTLTLRWSWRCCVGRKKTFGRSAICRARGVQPPQHAQQAQAEDSHTANDASPTTNIPLPTPKHILRFGATPITANHRRSPPITANHIFRSGTTPAVTYVWVVAIATAAAIAAAAIAAIASVASVVPTFAISTALAAITTTIAASNSSTPALTTSTALVTTTVRTTAHAAHRSDG